MAYVRVLTHAGILAAYGFFGRVPMFFLATSNQAHIGGTTSTPDTRLRVTSPMVPNLK